MVGCIDANCYRIRADRHTSPLRGAKRRSNPDCLCGTILDCFAALATTGVARVSGITLSPSRVPGAHRPVRARSPNSRPGSRPDARRLP
ncbi:hypothetical protein DCG74_21795 [Bradyrhizobium sp. WBAH42]|nr:hypothetical protein DCG74_21795 [Bradyrhizobium sp. WBAH42]